MKNYISFQLMKSTIYAISFKQLTQFLSVNDTIQNEYYTSLVWSIWDTTICIVKYSISYIYHMGSFKEQRQWQDQFNMLELFQWINKVQEYC